MFLRRFLALLSARNKEFLRDKSSTSWNIIMPILIVAGFAVTFTSDFSDQYKVGVFSGTDSTQTQNTNVSNFLKTKHIEFVQIADIEKENSKGFGK